jgi:hypothetical protein
MFWMIIVHFRIKLKIELFKKTIHILNYNAHGVTKYSKKKSQIIHLFKKVYFFLHIFSILASRDTFVPTKIVLKVGFLKRDFERDHLAEKRYKQKWAKKYITGYKTELCKLSPHITFFS